MKSIIKESTVYDNCMDLKAAESMPTVANFIDDPTFASQAPKYKSTVKNIGGAYKSIYVSFRTKEDLREFANLIKMRFGIQNPDHYYSIVLMRLVRISF